MSAQRVYLNVVIVQRDKNYIEPDILKRRGYEDVDVPVLPLVCSLSSCAKIKGKRLALKKIPFAGKESKVFFVITVCFFFACMCVCARARASACVISLERRNIFFRSRNCDDAGA